MSSTPDLSALLETVNKLAESTFGSIRVNKTLIQNLEIQNEESRRLIEEYRLLIEKETQKIQDNCLQIQESHDRIKEQEESRQKLESGRFQIKHFLDSTSRVTKIGSSLNPSKPSPDQYEFKSGGGSGGGGSGSNGIPPPASLSGLPALPEEAAALSGLPALPEEAASLSGLPALPEEAAALSGPEWLSLQDAARDTMEYIQNQKDYELARELQKEEEAKSDSQRLPAAGGAGGDGGYAHDRSIEDIQKQIKSLRISSCLTESIEEKEDLRDLIASLVEERDTRIAQSLS
jgi:hypothetical protein